MANLQDPSYQLNHTFKISLIFSFQNILRFKNLFDTIDLTYFNKYSDKNKRHHYFNNDINHGYLKKNQASYFEENISFLFHSSFLVIYNNN